ncbi:hypothetical protein Tco_0625615 [Tanacetum coccineum]|uniref:Uncharacterized protein n=1 Tax=Tanacetum coccineum TaxID=301880 RepID=A0ABQ4WHE2_9ASTR
MSSSSTNSTTRTVNTAQGVNTASTQGAADSSTTVENLSGAPKCSKMLSSFLHQFNKQFCFFLICQFLSSFDLESLKPSIYQPPHSFVFFPLNQSNLCWLHLHCFLTSFCSSINSQHPP